MPAAGSTASAPHSLFGDFYAILVGSALVVAGLVFLGAAGLVTGGLAGVALLISYFIPLSAGTVLMILSIPFFVFGGRMMGSSFLFKTIAASICISLFSSVAPVAFSVIVLSKPIVALLAGIMTGMGSLALARHGAGVGGLGILFLWLERERGWNPGKIQAACNCIVFLASAAIIRPIDLLWSSLSTISMVTVLILWQRPAATMEASQGSARCASRASSESFAYQQSSSSRVD